MAAGPVEVITPRKDVMSQLRRAKNLVKSTFRPPSPERAPAGTPSRTVTLGTANSVGEGRITAFKADEREIAVAYVGGTYYAFNDICTHRRCSLADGQLDGTTVTCICHGSRFEVSTGDVVRGPAQRALEVYPVSIEGDELRVDVPINDAASS
jgi:nitrite reductase/ring-hydroxylating ferredoxin subunit